MTLFHIPDIHPLGPRKRLCTDTTNHHTVSPGVQDNVMRMLILWLLYGLVI